MRALAWLAVGGVGAAAAGATVVALALTREAPAVAAAAEALAIGGQPTAAAHQDLESLNAPYSGKVHFVRIRFETRSRGGFGFGRGGRGGPVWAHDYPRADRNFMQILEETTYARGLLDGSNVLALDDPRLFQHPIAYIVEVGAWEPTDAEAAALGTYLRKGGFLIVDDFRGDWELQNFAFQMGRVLPGAQLLPLGDDHEIFDSFFRINPKAVLPPYGPRDATWYGVFERNDPARRLMAVINHNNDIAEYWEYSDRGFYPIDLSNEAYKLGVNYFIYALTH